MAFFGITSFGSYQPLKSALASKMAAEYFTEEDYKKAFEVIDKDHSGCLTFDEIENLLKKTYGFEPTKDEVQIFIDQFDTNKDNKISWDEFKTGLSKIKEALKQKDKTAIHYTSHKKYLDDRFKHKRIPDDPNKVYKEPVTFSYSTGFKKQEDYMKGDTFPRKACNETKYVEEMHKNHHV